MRMAKPITRTISALTGTHLPLGGEKQSLLNIHPFSEIPGNLFYPVLVC